MQNYDHILEQYPNNLPVNEASKLMDKSPMFVRCGLRCGNLMFGYAVQMEGGHWSYYINTRTFIKCLEGEMPLTIRDLVEPIAKQAITEYQKLQKEA